jgi:hypothetical protein
VIYLPAALDRHHKHNPLFILDRENDTPASYSRFAQTALVREFTRESGILGIFSKLPQSRNHAFSGVGTQPIQVLRRPIG